jgi:DNA-binding MarR family transcriptional regulator
MKISKLLFIVALMFSLSSFSQEVDQAAVNKMLQQFQAKGILNAEQAQDARNKLQQITPEQWGQIRKQAEQMKAEGRVPAANTANDVDAAAQMLDPNSPEFKQTMDKLKGILEKNKDNLEIEE